MGEMASLWSYDENHEMEQLGQKLMYTTLELEKLKAEAVEEMRKNNEYTKQLIQLLKYAIQERDEARSQFQKLLHKTMPITGESFPSIPLFQSDFMKPAKANSSITESNSMSETYNLHSHASSPVDSLFDAVSSPEFTNINLVVNNNNNNHQQHFAHDSNVLLQNSHVTSCIEPRVDQASLIVDNLAKGAVLPQKGKFLQSVLQAGPLLQTLLVAGPLPRWRNPPQFQAFQIPPFSIKACEGGEVLDHKPVSNLGQLSSRSQSSQPYAQLSCASAQVHSSAPMLSFASLASGTSLSNGSLISPAMNANAYAPLAKRQRFC